MSFVSSSSSSAFDLLAFRESGPSELSWRVRKGGSERARAREREREREGGVRETLSEEVEREREREGEGEGGRGRERESSTKVEGLGGFEGLADG